MTQIEIKKMKVTSKERREYIVLTEEQAQWYHRGFNDGETGYILLEHTWGDSDYPKKYKVFYNAGVTEFKLRSELKEHIDYYKIK